MVRVHRTMGAHPLAFAPHVLSPLTVHQGRGVGVTNTVQWKW